MRPTSILSVAGRRFRLGPRTWIMGVINITPDSFSDGGLYLDEGRAAARGLEMAADGADIIDIGGESTRPGSEPVDIGEEKRRILPVLRRLRRQTDVLISVDTTKAAVAEAAFAEGADILNDTSALRFDPAIAAAARAAGAAVILMHMQGTPRTMQLDPRYDDVVGEVRAFLEERLAAAETAGIGRDRLAVDPGIGFGKTVDHNLTLLDGLEALTGLGRPVCVGVSRKAFIGKILDLPVEERLEGTIAAAVLAAARGAHILRVHDVRAVKRAAAIADAILARTGRPAEEEKIEKASHVV